MASRAKCKAAVQELTAMACLHPIYSANSLSNNFTLGPVVTHPDLRTSRTSLISSSSMTGRFFPYLPAQSLEPSQFESKGPTYRMNDKTHPKADMNKKYRKDHPWQKPPV
jgi:hypothetical protein